jgi:hypothetical protein
MRQQLITLVLGEVSRKVRGEIFKPALVKSAPAYSETAVPRQVVIGQEAVVVDGRSITFHLRGYAPDVLLIEARTDVDSLFKPDVFALEESMYREARRILEARGGKRTLSEEYSVFTVAGYEGAPEQFLAHAPIMASLLKSERFELDPKEIEHTMRAQIKYAMNDLAILDWDGAFVFDPEGDFEEDIELLVLANLQLLRHRILDYQLDERLARLAELVHRRTGRRPFAQGEVAHDFRESIQLRTTSISELQRLDREIKLIGDWYSARFFELASAKFRIDSWRSAIRSKLESLEDIYSIVVENFTVSTKHRAEWLQIIAFFILQVGWFILIILEFLYFTRTR